MRSEHGWLRRLGATLGPSTPQVIVGIGDDAAVLAAPSAPLVATVDAAVEDVFVRFDGCVAGRFGMIRRSARLLFVIDRSGSMLAALDGDLLRLCNTSGRDYRELGLSARLPTLSPDEALALLAGNGNLIKRPVLLGPGVALAGFQPEAWRAALSR